MDERTLSITNTLHHDHCYSHRIPYFSSHLPTEERSHDVPPGIKVDDYEDDAKEKKKTRLSQRGGN